MFAIEPHPGIADTLRLRLDGVWNVPTMLVFERAVATAAAAMPCGPGGHLLLIDIRDFETQSEEIVLMCRAMIERGQDGLGVAFVIGEGAAREQLPQVIGDAPLNVFDDQAIAEAWLVARRAETLRRAA